MNTEVLTDSFGNTLSMVRQIPSFGYQISLTTKDGANATFDLAGENLKVVADKLTEASNFAAKVGN